MRRNAMNTSSDSQNQDTPVPFALTPLAIEDFTDTPVYALTPEGQQALLAQTILDALDAFPHRPLVLAEDFQKAKDAYAVVMIDGMDHDAFMRAQEAFNKACRQLFFGLHTMTKYGF